MKRWLALVVISMLVFSGCGGKGSAPPADPPKEPTTDSPVIAEPIPAEPETEHEELAAVRAETADSGALMAVAYLGYAELPFFWDVSVYLEANGFGDVYPFLTDVTEERFVRQDGGELYAVVPESDDVELIVYEYIMDETDDYIPDPGAELLRVSDGQPILLIGNVSEIVPNLFVRAEKKDGTVVEYAPCLSMMDGSLSEGEGVYDFTPTELLSQWYPGYDPVPEIIFADTWYAQHTDENEELMALTLTLDNDGGAEYFYGCPDGEILEWFEGTWSLTDDDLLHLELYGGPISWEEDGSEDEWYELDALFQWEGYSTVFELRHVDGDPILRGTEGEVFDLLPFNGFYLMGDWVAETQYRDWEYKLRLFDNGECWLNLYETDGDDLVGYEGWWSVEDGILSLSLLHCDGEHPENPELYYMWGEYTVELSDYDHMTMTYSDGSILTLDMEESTIEEFVRLG